MCDTIGNLPIQYILVDPSAAGFIETIKKYAKYIVKGADTSVFLAKAVHKSLVQKRIVKQCVLLAVDV